MVVLVLHGRDDDGRGADYTFSIPFSPSPFLPLPHSLTHSFISSLENFIGGVNELLRERERERERERDGWAGSIKLGANEKINKLSIDKNKRRRYRKEEREGGRRRVILLLLRGKGSK